MHAKKKSAGAKYFGKPLTDDPDDAPELLNDFFRHGEVASRRQADPARPAAIVRQSRRPRSRCGSTKMS